MITKSKQKKTNKIQTKNIKLVITTINGENDVIKAYAEKFKDFRENLILVGDKKTPEFNKLKLPKFLNIASPEKT